MNIFSRHRFLSDARARMRYQMVISRPISDLYDLQRRSLRCSSYLGSQHDAGRSRSSGAGGRYQSVAGTRRRQLSIDTCHPRPSCGKPAARRCRVGLLTVDRRDRQTDRRTDTVPLHRRSPLEAGSVDNVQ